MELAMELAIRVGGTPPSPNPEAGTVRFSGMCASAPECHVDGSVDPWFDKPIRCFGQVQAFFRKGVGGIDEFAHWLCDHIVH
eukprot:8713361-Alexandrium_andersonii.AAC.1